MTMYYTGSVLSYDLHLCYEAFAKWASEGRELPNYKMNYGGVHLKWLLGREDEDMSPTAEDIDLARKLSGEHGWTIYKMLLARRLPENEF